MKSCSALALENLSEIHFFLLQFPNPPEANKSCVFPFTYLGSNYTTCTEQESPSGEAWCATKVDDNGDYIGKWGYCGAACGVQNQEYDGSALVAGMTIEELEDLPFLDLQRIFAEAFIDDKAYLLEKINRAKMRKLFKSVTPEDKQHILSNHPRVFARAVEGFTWDRRKGLEEISKTIDDIVQKTVGTGGSSSHSVHGPLQQDKGRANPEDTPDKFRASERAKQEKERLKKYAATSRFSVASNIGQALQKGTKYLGASARQEQAGVRFENRMAKAENSIQGVAGGFKKIQGGEVMTKVSGVLDILGSVAAFAGPYGRFVSSACGFVNVILDLAGAGGPSLQEQIGKMINDQTDEIKNYIDTSVWNQEIGKLVRELEAFQPVQREKYIFMDAVLSGGGITRDDVQAALTLHGSLFDSPRLHEAANFFREQCHVRSTDENRRKACAKLLFAYTGLAAISDITNTKLVSVLAAANLHNVKRGLLAVIEERKRSAKVFLSEIFANISKANDFSCNYNCPLTVYDTGLLLSEWETQLILNYAVSLGISSKATLDSCRRQCGRAVHRVHHVHLVGFVMGSFVSKSQINHKSQFPY